MIQIRTQMKASGVQLPEVHGSRKGLDTHKILEKQPQPIARLSIEKKPRLGQGRAGMRREMKAPPSQYTCPRSSESKPIILMVKLFQLQIQYYLSLYQKFQEVRYYCHIFFCKTDLLQNPLIN